MKTIIANWKMNLNVPSSSAYFVKLSETVETDDVEVVLCPTYLALQTLNLQNDGRFKLGAQNCSTSDDGALTGEVSAAMLAGVASHVIVGHSERRQLFHETDSEINQKVQAALRHGLTPILCVGNDRGEDIVEVLNRQLNIGLDGVTVDQLDQIIIAYEPVYAIGGGQAAAAGDIEFALATIRTRIGYLFGDGAQIRLLYGGSTDETNTAEILSIDGIDGLLVGRASLDAVKFAKIVKEARRARE